MRCHYFFYRQRPEDSVLQALVTKTETIQEDVRATRLEPVGLVYLWPFSG